MAYSDMPLELIPPEAIVNVSGNTKDKDGDVDASTSPAETPSKGTIVHCRNSLFQLYTSVPNLTSLCIIRNIFLIS